MSEHQAGEAQWKQKYFAQLEKYEREERHWAQIEELLTKALSRVSLAAEGLSAELDEQLKSLRELLRKRPDQITLQSRLQHLSDTLLALEGRSGKRQQRSPTQVWANLFESLSWPRAVRRDARLLRKKLSKVKYPSELSALMPEIERLLAQALAETAPVQAGGSDSWWSRLFGGQKTAAFVAVDVAAPKLNGDTRRNLEESCILLEPFIELADRRDEHGGSEHDAVFQSRLDAIDDHGQLRAFANDLAIYLGAKSDLKRGDKETESSASLPAVNANELLINLLDRLTLPPELDAKLAALREQLLAPIDAADLPGALQGVCDLVAEMRRKVQREKEDLEQFLAQLTTRLQELDERLSGTRSENEASRMSGQALNVAVSAEVSHIASTMRDAADLDVLKKLVQDRLEEIRRHMDAYRAAEDDRHKQTDEKVRALLDRLRELEDETSSLRNRVREQRSEALRDTLTGIFNRLAYDERIDQEFLRWKRFNEPVSVMVWDVDFFKSINDTYGHKAGDKVLVSIAKMLASQIRETDFIARYGGEEFVIVAPGSDAATSLKVADKLRQSIEQKGFRHRDAPVPVTISCGIAEFKAGSTPDSVFEAADQALYQAKQEGRNRCVVAS